MQILLKKAMIILVIAVLVACMLLTFIACNDDSGKNKDGFGKNNDDARFVKCPECYGSGEKIDAYHLKVYKCPRCNGKGYIIR